MKKITQLVKTMKPAEVRALRKYFAMNASTGDNLKIKLFDLARQNPGISDKEAIQILGKKNNSGWSMLKSRLQKDIMRIILYEYDKSLSSSKYFQARYQCRRLMLEAEILGLRGLMPSFEEKLNKAAAIARKFELNHELLTINTDLAERLKIVRGVAYSQRLNQKSRSEIDSILARMKAGEYFRKISVDIMQYANKRKSFFEQSKSALIEIEAIMKQNDSVWVKYLFLRGQYVHNYISFNYAKAKKYALEFLDLISNHIVFHSDNNYFGANFQLSTIYIYTQDYDEAANYGLKAKGYLYITDVPYIQIQENLFLSYFYEKKILECELILQETKQLQTYKPGNLFYSKFIFYEANLKFLQGKYKEALNYLRRHNSLFKDKSGYRVGIKLLEILCIIELETYDLLEYRIEALRKLLSSIRSENISRPNIELQMIRALVRYNFDFVKTNKKFTKELNLLKTAEDDYRWDAFGYEIIRFDEWWQSKLKPVKVMS